MVSFPKSHNLSRLGKRWLGRLACNRESGLGCEVSLGARATVALTARYMILRLPLVLGLPMIRS